MIEDVQTSPKIVPSLSYSLSHFAPFVNKLVIPGMGEGQWTCFLVLGVSVTSVGVVLVTAILSVLTVYCLKSLFICIISLLKVITEIAVALAAAFVSGTTIALSVLVAVWASAMTIPASYIEIRIAVSVAVAMASIVSSACLLLCCDVIKSDVDVAVAVISAAALSVSIAAAWAVGVLSLIEKETQQVGLRMTSILDAVKNNNFRILKLLLSFNRNLHQKELNIALMHAVKANYPECAKSLLSHDADSNAQDAHGYTCLFIAAENGFYRIVKLLLDAGCLVDVRSDGKGTALHQAAKWGHLNCVELLLARGAEPNIRDGLWHTPLILAARDSPDAQSMMRALVDAKCNVNSTGMQQKTALHFACHRGLDIGFLLDAGADIEPQDVDGNTPLHTAAEEGHTNVMTILLKRGCNANIANQHGKVPLHYACIKDHVGVVSALIGWGADVNVLDSDNHSSIWMAVANGNDRTVKQLLQANAMLIDKPLKSSYQFTCHELLLLALERRYFLILKYLVLAGAILTSLQHHLRDPKLMLTIEERWVDSLIHNPLNLSQICRNKIRQCAKGQPFQMYYKLPLPRVLQDYVNMKDLDSVEDFF